MTTNLSNIEIEEAPSFASNWYEDEPMVGLTEYIRADIAQAQLDAANARIAELEGNLSALRYDLNLYHEMAQQQLKGIHNLQTCIIERDARIAELEAAQAWVSVDERLPEPLDDVLVSDGVTVAIGYASKHGAWNLYGWSDLTPTHWMPLPPPVTDVTP